MSGSKHTAYIDKQSDFHIHTRFCNHASGEMEEYVQHAIEKGLRQITFLEHMEEGIRAERRIWLTESDFTAYFAEGRRLQKKYADRIKVGLGVECGFNPDHGKILKKRLLARQWDQIGISCHFLELEADRDHLNMFSRRKEYIERAQQYNLDELLTKYFSSLIEAVHTLPGTILCHLDGALRHVPGLKLSDQHYLQIEKLLTLVKNKGMAMEYNTSGIRIRGEVFPAQRIREMAAAKNIPVVLSSDAHKPGDVGSHFSDINSPSEFFR